MKDARDKKGTKEIGPLRLSRETLRELDASELRQVAAGARGKTDPDCRSAWGTCPKGRCDTSLYC